MFFFHLFGGGVQAALSNIQLEDLNYADVNNNEAIQVLPIPTRIHEIIFPTLGFPSLVFPGDTFSIILQLSDEQAKVLQENINKIYPVIALSPYIGHGVSRGIPTGLESYYRNYNDFEEHQATGAKPFVPYFRTNPLKPRKMQQEMFAQWEYYRLSDHKLFLTVRLPKEVSSHLYRVHDLEVRIFIGDQQVIHDIQRHSVGVLEKKEAFRFVHLADPQINNLGFQFYGNKFNRPDDLNTQEFALEQAVKELNFLRPDFGVMSGDLVEGGNNYYNSGSMGAFFAGMEMIFEPYNDNSHYYLEKSSYWNEYQSIVQFLRELSFPTFNAVGNHDGYAAYVKQNEVRTLPQLSLTKSRVGVDSEPILYDGKHFWRKMIGPRYYSFDFGPWHFVAMDTFDHYRFYRIHYSNFGANNGGWISEEQMEWLKSDLEAARQSGKKIILFGHHDPRGGVHGMFFDDETRRYPRRTLLRLGDELWYQYKQYQEDMLYAGQEWAGVKAQGDTEGIIDPTYDSAKELLKLISEYPVTHVFLGHVHAGYEDEVKMNGRVVRFIHTTALSAQPTSVRNTEDYHQKTGEGEAKPAHWGYRMFEIDLDGNLREFSDLELGKLRISVGIDSTYRSQLGGIISPKRPLPTWLPYSDVIHRVAKEKALPFLFSHGDPIISFYALLNPNLKDKLRPLLLLPLPTLWDQTQRDTISDAFSHLYFSVLDEVGKDELAKKILIYNGNAVSVNGILEFPIRYEMGKEVMLSTYSSEWNLVESHVINSQTYKTQEGRWGSMGLELPAQNSVSHYVTISLAN